MKKIYLSLAGLALCGAVFGQVSNGLQDREQRRADLSPFVKKAQPTQVIGERSTDFSYWIDPVADMMFNKGVNLDDNTKPYQEILFLAPMFMDSTVNVSTNTATTPVNYNQIGNVMDLRSIFLKPEPGTKPPPSGGSEPIVTPQDDVKIDSLDIIGSYVKKNPNVTDTLYIWLVWGDSLDANIFTKRKSADLWVAPLFNWRYNAFGPAVTGSGPNQGNVIAAKAGASNMKLIKRVLTNADTSKGLGYSKDIYVEVNALVPGGKTISCFYTFVPQAGSYTAGQTFYAFKGPKNEPPLVAQQTNGYAATVWEQDDPEIKTVNDYKDYQIDPTPGGCISTGVRMTKNGRYGKSSALTNGALIGIPISTPYIIYKISGKSTVGITEHSSNFSLSQNVPNPFTSETTIAYNLKTPAKNVSLFIYNLAGVKVFEKAQTNVGAGRYTVEVSNSNFASGIYFYSLNVDGNQITKKMVVTE